MTIRLYYNKTKEGAKWVLHFEETNEVQFFDKVLSFGVSHETEKAPQIPNLKAEYVVKYLKAKIKNHGTTAIIFPRDADES